MKQAMVRAERIGRGTRADPFRAALADHIVEVPGRSGYWDWRNPFTPSNLAFVKGRDADVDAALADVRITPVSPVFTTDRALDDWTQEFVMDSPGIVRSIFEQDRIPVDWVSDRITWSKFLIFVSAWHSSMQHLRSNDAASFTALDKTLNQELTVRELLTVRVWTALAEHGFKTPRRLTQDIARQPFWDLLSLGPFTTWNTRRVRSFKPIVKRG